MPSVKFGAPLHHPRFLEWIDAPESPSLLEMGLEMWLHSLSREQAIDAARQLRLLDDNELGRFRSICAVPSGYGVENTRT